MLMQAAATKGIRRKIHPEEIQPFPWYMYYSLLSFTTTITIAMYLSHFSTSISSTICTTSLSLHCLLDMLSLTLYYVMFSSLFLSHHYLIAVVIFPSLTMIVIITITITITTTITTTTTIFLVQIYLPNTTSHSLSPHLRAHHNNIYTRFV